MNTEKMMRTLRLRKVVVRECFQGFFRLCKGIMIVERERSAQSTPTARHPAIGVEETLRSS